MEKCQKSFFTCWAERIASWSGKPVTFLTAALMVLLWAILGPVFKFSDTWQLIINSATSIITFLMVFLIQNTQNKDTKAIQLKLGELIRTTEGAHTVLLDLEQLSEEEIDVLQKKYEKIATEARRRLKQGKTDTDIPDVILDA